MLLAGVSQPAETLNVVLCKDLIISYKQCWTAKFVELWMYQVLWIAVVSRGVENIFLPRVSIISESERRAADNLSSASVVGILEQLPKTTLWWVKVGYALQRTGDILVLDGRSEPSWRHDRELFRCAGLSFNVDTRGNGTYPGE